MKSKWVNARAINHIKGDQLVIVLIVKTVSCVNLLSYHTGIQVAYVCCYDNMYLFMGNFILDKGFSF
jgi:hypothetical protein